MAAGHSPRRRPRFGIATVKAAALGLAATLTALAAGPAPARADVAGAPVSFADIVDRVKGSVVSIYITGKGDSADQGTAPDTFPDLPQDNPLNQFFKKFKKGDKSDKGGGEQSTPEMKALGSGFVISEDGFIVTNNHVIEGATKIEVSFDEEERIGATLVGADPRTDLALIKIKSDKKFSAVKFAKKPVRVGDWVIAIGNPFGLGGTVTAGIVSALARDIQSGPYDYLQIDAPVNKGNSGGPTFNLDGEVVGVNSAIFSPSGGSVGIAFDIPGELAKQVIADLKSKGSVSRGWLGVHIQNVTDDIASSLGLKDSHGALINKITEKGPADGSELKVGDVVMAVDGKKVSDSRDLARLIAELSPGAAVRLTVFRDAKEREVTIKLGQFPDESKLAKMEESDAPKVATPETKDIGEMGLSLAPASVLGKESNAGVLITKVVEGSEAAARGLHEGDIILEVAGSPVSSPTEVLKGVDEARKQGRKVVLMRVHSDDGDRFVPLKLAAG